MCFHKLLRAIGRVGTGMGSYEEHYNAVQARYEQASFAEAASIWSAFVRELDGTWSVYKTVAGVYTSYVPVVLVRGIKLNELTCAAAAHCSYRTVVGLLSMSGVPSGPVTVCLGILCLQASLFSFAYSEAYHCLMPRMNEPLQGFDWLNVSCTGPSDSERRLTVARTQARHLLRLGREHRIYYLCLLTG